MNSAGMAHRFFFLMIRRATSDGLRNLTPLVRAHGISSAPRGGTKRYPSPGFSDATHCKLRQDAIRRFGDDGAPRSMSASDSVLEGSGPTAAAWSSNLTVYLCTAGVAVGLGSIWRFPYLAGTGGGSAFILIFVLACVLVATPLLAAELAMGRASRLSPPDAAGALALAVGGSTRWNAIGVLGTLAASLIFSYYTVIAAW